MTRKRKPRIPRGVKHPYKLEGGPMHGHTLWLSCGGTLTFTLHGRTGPCRERYAASECQAPDAAPQQPAAVDGAIDNARFERAPCYLCGYNGPGYYQPDTHPCAAKYHAALAEISSSTEE